MTCRGRGLPTGTIRRRVRLRTSEAGEIDLGASPNEECAMCGAAGHLDVVAEVGGGTGWLITVTSCHCGRRRLAK